MVGRKGGYASRGEDRDRRAMPTYVAHLGCSCLETFLLLLVSVWYCVSSSGCCSRVEMQKQDGRCRGGGGSWADRVLQVSAAWALWAFLSRGIKKSAVSLTRAAAQAQAGVLAAGLAWTTVGSAVETSIASRATSSLGSPPSHRPPSSDLSRGRLRYDNVCVPSDALQAS